MPEEGLPILKEPGKRGSLIFVALLVGIALGVAGTVLLPRWAGPHMPEIFRKSTLIDGTVLAKEAEPNRLLLKISTGEGVLLATFTQKKKEIDFLIEKGDVVTLKARQYLPFLDEPTIQRIRKAALPSEAKPVEPVPPVVKPEPEKPVEPKPPAAKAEREKPAEAGSRVE